MKAVGPYEYDTESEIGRGVFGIVFKGCNRTTSTEVVAIKEVDVKNYKLKFLHDTINRETKILEKVSNPSHKNIVTLLHFEQQDHFVYFVMEFYNGGNLQEYLASKLKLEETTIRLFLRQIADGLKAAHDMQIIHRDLKPENILLCFSGFKYPSPNNITLKIADFGIGRFLNPDEMALTSCGTLFYMAPEILYQRPYGYKVDLWSVGVMAYECLDVSLPKDRSMAVKDVEIPTHISPKFAHLLTGLLEADEDNRFSMKEFFNHEFLATTISVSVAGPSNQTKLIQVADNRTVDHLIDNVCFKYNTDCQAAYLVHDDGRTFERGSGNSLKDSGIVHNSSVTLVLRLSGGNDYNRKALPDSPSSVSRQNCLLQYKDRPT